MPAENNSVITTCEENFDVTHLNISDGILSTYLDNMWKFGTTTAFEFNVNSLEHGQFRLWMVQHCRFCGKALVATSEEGIFVETKFVEKYLELQRIQQNKQIENSDNSNQIADFQDGSLNKFFWSLGQFLKIVMILVGSAIAIAIVVNVTITYVTEKTHITATSYKGFNIV